MSADMVKLVDMPDLGSGAARRVGSSPIIRTKASQSRSFFYALLFGCCVGFMLSLRMKCIEASAALFTISF